MLRFCSHIFDLSMSVKPGWWTKPTGMRICSFRSINTHIVTKRKQLHLNKYLTRLPVRFGHHNIFYVCVLLCNYVNFGSNKFRIDVDQILIRSESVKSMCNQSRSEETYYLRLCVFSSPFFIMMIARMRVIHFNLILKSGVWPIFI